MSSKTWSQKSHTIASSTLDSQWVSLKVQPTLNFKINAIPLYLAGIY